MTLLGVAHATLEFMSAWNDLDCLIASISREVRNQHRRNQTDCILHPVTVFVV
jgi:hypothetical protein